MESGFKFNTTRSRSDLMKKIRSKNTGPELILRKKLWELGIRYRLYYKGLPGKPDIFISKYKIAIFIDGEFWHGFNWDEKKSKILSNRDYWIRKIEGNIIRDQQINIQLAELGYHVLRFWEHEIRKELDTCVDRILKKLNS